MPNLVAMQAKQNQALFKANMKIRLAAGTKAGREFGSILENQEIAVRLRH